MRNRFCLVVVPVLVFMLITSWSTARTQGPTGGGSLTGDIVGGAALIFRAPKDPIVDLTASNGSTIGGGKINGRPQKPPVRRQDQMIARGNAARSAAKPRYAEAEKQYQLATQVAPDDSRAFVGLGNIYVDQGRFGEAVEAYKQAIKIKPDYDAAYLPLAFSLARLSRFDEAIEVYQQILKRNALNPEVYNNLSFAFNHTERFQEAADASKQAINE